MPALMFEALGLPKNPGLRLGIPVSAFHLPSPAPHPFLEGFWLEGGSGEADVRSENLNSNPRQPRHLRIAPDPE